MAESLLYPTRTSDPFEPDPPAAIQVRALQDELSRTRAELETLRLTTAQLLTAVLAELHGQGRPVRVAQVAPEIQSLAELSSLTDEDLHGASGDQEFEAVDLTDRESLTYLDRRFRWVPGSKARD